MACIVVLIASSMNPMNCLDVALRALALRPRKLPTLFLII